MPRYVITEKAGRIVAGQRNSGVGTEIDLTEQEAKAGVREGTLILRKEPEEATSADEVSDDRKTDARSAAKPKAATKDDSK